MIKNIFFFFLLFSTVSFAQEQLSSINLTESSDSDCQAFIKSIQDSYTYGWISAPVNYDSPGAGSAKIFYYYKKTDHIKNPILFLNGGPGGSSHSSYSLFDKKMAELQIKNNFDFIFMDQRGTGCSTPTYPFGADIKTLETLKWSASLGIVKDAEILREFLFGPKTKWKIFGQSYGAYIVYRYLEKFPASISKAYAHGNAIGVTNFDGSYFRILSQQTVLEKYFKNYPDDRLRMNLLNLFLSDSTKCFANSLNQQMCGAENLSPFVYLLGFNTNWKFIHIYLRQIVPEKSVDDLALKNYVSQNVSQNFYYRQTLPIDSTADQMTFFYNFAGLYDWDSTPLDAIKCEKIYARLKENKISTDQFLLNECMAPLQFKFKDQIADFLKLKIDLTNPQFTDSVTVNKNLSQYKIPLYSYSGELDCFVPKQFFTKQLKLFGSKVIYRNFENSGHEGFYTERQIYSDLAK
jgi:pimeloyl-ACP methyl ester carboxylesterase